MGIKIFAWKDLIANLAYLQKPTEGISIFLKETKQQFCFMDSELTIANVANVKAISEEDLHVNYEIQC